MPRSADPAVRAALLDAATRVLAAEGPHALTTRRLATEVGASTMAVYTHFGGMDELHQAVRAEGFGRLGAAIDAGRGGNPVDPVADLAAGVGAYVGYGSDHPELYRAMYAGRPPGRADAGAEVFGRLVAAVGRCVDAGRFERPATPDRWAAELWITGHGVVTLTLSGTIPADQLDHLLADMVFRLFVGYGDDPTTAQRSVERGCANHG